MSDEFLYRLREPPRPEFAEALKARVFQERPRSSAWRRFVLERLYRAADAVKVKPHL